ncbi:MAG: hypothetical protein HYR81_02835 [Nitrospirae bacterium]|nr:hypothetical protein [Nitrospirota bacterium]
MSKLKSMPQLQVKPVKVFIDPGSAKDDIHGIPYAIDADGVLWRYIEEDNFDDSGWEKLNMNVRNNR